MAAPRPFDSAFVELVECLGVVEDPRRDNATYPLSTVLFSILVGIMCGADDLVNAAQVAKLKADFIRRFVPLPGRVPSHDTMGRVLAAIDPDCLVPALARFIAKITDIPEREVINIDGKTLRGVPGKARTKAQAHMVSAFSTTRALVLASLRSTSVANEQQAAQELLKILDVEGAIITLDAAHTARETLELIEERGGDVVVAVKANSSKLLDAISESFKTSATPRVVETEEKRSGRVERRRYEVLAASGDAVDKSFPSIRSFIHVTRENTSHSETKKRQKRKLAESTNRFEGAFASSLPPEEAAQIAEIIRCRWLIENQLHYVLDMTFDEDRSRVRSHHAPENMARMRHVALGFLGRIKTPGMSYQTARLTAVHDEAFLSRALDA